MKGKKTHHLQDDTQLSADENANSSEDEFGLHRVDTRSADPIIVSLSLNGQKLDMEVDTGAAFSVISDATKQTLFKNKTLHSSNLVLKTYTDECMKVEGTLYVTVKYGNQTKKLMLVVVKGDVPSLLGRNWLEHIQFDRQNVFAIRTVKLKSLNSLLQQHETLFSKELGKIQPFTASLLMKPDATPQFFKPRPVPFAIKDAISQELDQLEKQRIISKVPHSQWATPIVPVPKKMGNFVFVEITKLPSTKLCQLKNIHYQLLKSCFLPYLQGKYSLS